MSATYVFSDWERGVCTEEHNQYRIDTGKGLGFSYTVFYNYKTSKQIYS